MSISRELILSFYRTMTEIREFELKGYEIFRSGKMPGFIHLYVGEEAVATGVCANLRQDDYVCQHASGARRTLWRRAFHPKPPWPSWWARQTDAVGEAAEACTCMIPR